MVKIIIELRQLGRYLPIPTINRSLFYSTLSLRLNILLCSSFGHVCIYAFTFQAKELIFFFIRILNC